MASLSNKSNAEGSIKTRRRVKAPAAGPKDQDSDVNLKRNG
jgi:hypothetical protein